MEQTRESVWTMYRLYTCLLVPACHDTGFWRTLKLQILLSYSEMLCLVFLGWEVIENGIGATSACIGSFVSSRRSQDGSEFAEVKRRQISLKSYVNSRTILSIKIRFVALTDNRRKSTTSPWRKIIEAWTVSPMKLHWTITNKRCRFEKNAYTIICMFEDSVDSVLLGK